MARVVPRAYSHAIRIMGGVAMRSECVAAVGLAVLVLGAGGALAEKVKGTETCTSGSYARKIGGKDYTCATKCTTPVTDTTCSPSGACSTTVYNEVSYKDCTEKAASTHPNTGVTGFGTFPSGGLLDDGGGGTGGGRPSPVGPAVRSPGVILK
jgi:hypothetical protein